jgi:cyclohexanone monooxygenase
VNTGEDSGGGGSARLDPVDVVVVGAGFAGMFAVHRLLGLGFSVQGFEAGDGVGGTWYWNRYPGARCDIPSIEYSYSFDEQLQQDWTWSQRYPSQPEMLRYADHVADRFGLRPHFRFETRVVSAVFDEAGVVWRVVTDTGLEISAKFVVMATGCLSVPRLPDVPGIADFRGEVFHTGQWPHEGVDLTGKRVGVIGTGASGIQSIPFFAEQAAHLIVFQRTPHYSVSGVNTVLTEDYIADVKAKYPELREYARRSFGGTMLRANKKSALEVDEQELEETFETAWKDGGFAFLASFRDITTDLAANRLAADFVKRKIAALVADPGTAALLSSGEYPLGTKRICIDTDYYATYNRENVQLVDIRADPLERVTETGIRTGAAEYELDVIIFATGFDAMTGALLRTDLRGRGGLTLAEAWSEGPRTYLGLQVAGFPNLFTVTGPGSPSVLSNVIAAGEQHVKFIADLLVWMREHGLDAVEPDVDAQNAWVEHVNDVADLTLYPLADSWYVGANIPGKPRVFMPYVGGVGSYNRRCTAVAAAGYEGFTTLRASDRPVESA